MDTSRTLLRVLLWMLALAAAAGVLAVFMSTDIMARVGGTAALTAVACGLAIPVSRRLDDQARRSGGLVGLCSILVAYVAAASAIWVDVVSRRWEVEVRLALTSVVLAAGGLIAGTLVNRARTGSGALAARAGLVLDLGAAALFLAATWAGIGSSSAFGPTSDDLAQTAWFCLLTGVPGSLSLIGAGARDRPWRWLGVIASGAAMAMAIAGIWFVHTNDPTLFIAVLTVAVVTAYANVIVRVPLGDMGPWVRIVALGATGATGACLTAVSYIRESLRGGDSDVLTRVTGASGIVAACSTIGVLILYRLNRRTPGVSRSVAEITSVQLACPYCGRKRTAPVGESPCPSCGLCVSVTLREPRCATCDYPLLGPPSDRCPECGTPRSTPSVVV